MCDETTANQAETNKAITETWFNLPFKQNVLPFFFFFFWSWFCTKDQRQLMFACSFLN